MWEYDRPRQATDDNIIWYMHFACWVPKATGTHLEYIIPIAFTQQQWLREHTSLSHYMYIACLVHYIGIIWLLCYI